jgi:oligosaccharide repeat unit polymerase
MVKRFLGVWIFFWLIVAILPVSSIYPATNEALLLQVCFVFLVVIAIVVILAESNVRLEPRNSFDIPYALPLIWTAIILSTVGLVALAYDKIMVQGIDFSHGLAAARLQWSELAAAREGRPSSVFSIAGYLLGSSYYVATTLAVAQRRAVSLPHRSAALAASFLLVLANSALTGGRSGLLLWVVFVLAAWGIRQGARPRDRLAGPFWRISIALALAIALGYVLFIFYQRADISSGQVDHYALEFLPFLGLKPDPWYVEWVDGAALGDLTAVLVLATSYLSHSFATVAAIVDAPTEDKTILFGHILDMMNRLGLAPQPDGDWFLAGRLPSVPGALWHQFGPSGFIVGSLLIGAICALANVWYAQRPTQLLPVGAYVGAEATLMLTPALLAFDVLSFPFAVVGFAILAVVQAVWNMSQPRAETGTAAAKT